MRRSSVLAAAFVCTAAASACGDATGPGPGLVGVYDLESIGGDALPVRYENTSNRFPFGGTTGPLPSAYTTLSGTFTLRPDSAYVIETRLRVEYAGQDPSATTNSSGGRWGVRGDTVLLYCEYCGESPTERYVVGPPGTLTSAPPPLVVSPFPGTVYRHR